MADILGTLREVAIAPLEEAYSMPFEAYTDQAVFEAESDKIFRNEWVFACMEGECPAPGDYFATRIDGEPIVVVRGQDSVLRAFSNICRHRGTPLLEKGLGKIKRNIVCPYHAWSYDLTGTLNTVPFNKITPVNPDEHALIPIRLEIWLGLVFVHLGKKAQSLRSRLSGIDDYLQLFEPEKFDTVLTGDTEQWQANWKLAIENGIESYYLFKVHRETLERYTPTKGAYYIAGSSEWTLTGGDTKVEQGLIDQLLSSEGGEIYNHYILISLPPSFIGVLSYGSLGWLAVNPVGPTSTIVRSGSTGLAKYISDDQASQKFTQAFFAEDKAICERVQSGMSAKLGHGGKLVDMERVVVDFHQFLATRLFDLPPTPTFEDDGAKLFKQ